MENQVANQTTEERIAKLLETTANLPQEVAIAFAENTEAEALELIEQRLRETRTYLAYVEGQCYEARRALQQAVRS